MGLPVNSPDLVLRQPLRAAVADARLWRLSQRVGDSTVFLVREASPLSRGMVEARILRHAHRSVYDFDDALYLPARGIVERVFSKAAKWRRCVEVADVVVAGNAELAEEAARAGARDVRMIPSCVDPSVYRVKHDFERARPSRAVWLGSPSTERYLQLIAPALLETHKVTGLTLTVISSGTRSLGALDQMTVRAEWSANAPQELATYDLGIMPLNDDAWARGKCAYKLLQYGAAGLPTIGSPVGANKEALSAMGGLPATNHAEWVDALVNLARLDASESSAMGTLARRGIERHFSFDAWAANWMDAVGIPR
jgi:glycosyltransferase involved in cell wall biosynthesis